MIKAEHTDQAVCFPLKTARIVNELHWELGENNANDDMHTTQSNNREEDMYTAHNIFCLVVLAAAAIVSLS